jgi:hypothetical protein
LHPCSLFCIILFHRLRSMDFQRAVGGHSPIAFSLSIGNVNSFVCVLVSPAGCQFCSRPDRSLPITVIFSTMHSIQSYISEKVYWSIIFPLLCASTHAKLHCQQDGCTNNVGEFIFHIRIDHLIKLQLLYLNESLKLNRLKFLHISSRNFHSSFFQ